MTTSPVRSKQLPGERRRGIDLIRDGVPGPELKADGDRAVWSALGRSALYWINGGGTYPDWVGEVLRPRSKLGHQARVTSRGKERSPKEVHKNLESAWARASERAIAHPAWTREQAREEATIRACNVTDLAQAAESALSEAQRAVLLVAAKIAEEVGSVVVNLPRRAIQERTGLGERATRTALTKLEDAGLLLLVERGRPRGARAGRSLANAYRLPDQLALDAFLSRETRQVGPRAQAGGTLRVLKSGTVPNEGPTSHGPSSKQEVVKLDVVRHPPPSAAPVGDRLDVFAALSELCLTRDEQLAVAQAALDALVRIRGEGVADARAR